MQSLKDLMSKIDIVDVIGSYIDLKRSGSNYMARCPFHPDDTPSLSVSPSKGIWKCFGCGVGGDAVKFVAMYEGISYREALIKLAEKYRIPIKLKTTKDEKIFLIMEEVANFYHQQLKGNERAKEYLKFRKVPSAMVERFMLGFSPSTEKLLEFLSTRGYLNEYEKTGNLYKYKDGSYRDIFLERLIIPIRDAKGRLVGFGGRTISDAQPKYINSPESSVFKKASVLFGLWQAKDYIREKQVAYLVEGYFDVIRMHSIGLKQTVAPLGTAFTQEHAGLLSRYAKRVILVFDGDEAGKKAVRTAASHLLSYGIEVFVCYLPEGEDPDSMGERDPKALENLINGAKNLFDLLIEEDNLKEYVYFAGFLQDGILKHELLTKLSRAKNIPIDSIYSMLPKKTQKKESSHGLSYYEKVFLIGLYRLKPKDVDLRLLNLSPEAMLLAEEILSGEEDLPDFLQNERIPNLEEAFRFALENLKIEKKSVSLRSLRKRFSEL
ncbi:DNA primase [Thermocrinis minervae]|uniref:DNA primase n=1 Tax=Thermocrinis minervae TaxID=381751 RepID=A0A1M6TFU0_9AQUI|nr:DNA primase [Thermocrinis minervae]SHK55744.1 DNA primase [Thermocrinis minervae]